MKKYNLLIVAIVAIFFVACNNTKEAETGDAKDVNEVKTDETITFSKIAEGSHLYWRATHLGGTGERFGKVFLKSVEFLVNDGQLTNATIEIDMPSLVVENFVDDDEKKAKLEAHLKNADFFDVEKYPTSKFELTKIESAEGEFNSAVTGNLTIMETTKSLTFNANVELSDDKITVKSEKFAIDRTNWNLTYNVEGTEGVPTDYLIANPVEFQIDVTIEK